jgi:VanZ family protein
LAVICYFSLLTTPPGPPTEQPLWDKQLHFVAYGALTLAFAYATVHYRDRPLVRGALVFGGTLGVGIMIELTQGLTPDRYFGWGDLLANSVGALLASVWFLLERRIRFVRVRRLAAPQQEP